MENRMSYTVYLYFQRQLLKAANNISTKKKLSSNDRELLEEIKDKGQLRTEMPFAEARQHLNEWYNIPLRYCTPVLKEMEALKLLTINGVSNHMKIQIINSGKARLLDNTSKLYRFAGCF